MTQQATTRSFPITCHECRRKSVEPTNIERTVDVRYEGVVYPVHVPELPVLRCTACGEITYGNDTQDVIHRAFRDQLNLLHPHEIRANRKALSLTQQRLANDIRCAAESLSRWENGSILQSRLVDNMLRAYFHLLPVRTFLSALSGNPLLGRTIVGTTPAQPLSTWFVVRPENWCAPIYSAFVPQLWASIENRLCASPQSFQERWFTFVMEPNRALDQPPADTATPETKFGLAA